MGLCETHATDPEILRTVVQRLLSLEAYEEAEDVAGALLRICPSDPDGVVARATAAGRRGGLQCADDVLATVAWPDAATAGLTASRVALSLDQPIAAWQAIQALPADRVPAPHAMTVAQRLLQQGHATLAEEAAVWTLDPNGGDADVRRKVERIVGEVAVLRGAWTPPAWETAPLRPVGGRVLHVVGASAPYRRSGYAVRTQALAQAQRAAGLAPHVVTPLGFPWTDGADGAELVEDVDGIPHHRLVPFAGAAGIRYGRGEIMTLMPSRRDERLSQSATRLAILGRMVRPAVLHAASDFHNALLALAVGRFFAIPVVYEVRGFWQETWLSRSTDHRSEAEVYAWRSERERECALQADHVVTLAEVMRRELEEMGVPSEKITVIPNAVDVDAFVPTERDGDLADQLGIADDDTILGYITSMVPYEGIRYLIEATAKLVAAGHQVRTLLVGDGTERGSLEAHAAALGIADRVIFTGWVPHAEVLRYYGLIDAFVVPRTADRVSRLVTPLKPYEAMATARAVVVSGVPALQEMVVPGETGLVFTPEDADHLAAVVEPLIANRDYREELGRAARGWVCAHRTWAENGRRYRALYERLGVPLTAPEDEEELYGMFGELY